MQHNQFGVPRTMQWFFIILVTIWLLASMALPLIAFCLTRNPFSFSFFGTLAPPIYILRRIIWYVFPKDDRDYELKKARIKYKAQYLSGIRGLRSWIPTFSSATMHTAGIVARKDFSDEDKVST